MPRYRLVGQAAALALLLILSGLSATARADAARPTLDQTLPNGLRVLVYENPRAPTALHMVWVKAGSIDETNGRTGLAHVLEHMMFKGTRRLAPGEFSRRIAALGGRENAFTSKDYTGYFQQVHRDSLREVMRLEAERQRHLVIDPAEFAKEIEVVKEERRLRTDDNPAALAYETLVAQAFVANPVRNPIIGWMNDLDNLTARDAMDWYRTWYAPGNLILVVAGDVKAPQVLAWAREFYGSMPAKALPERRPQVEPEQNGMRRAVLRAPAQNPFVMLAYKAPVLRAELGPLTPAHEPARDLVALDVLSTLLDDPGTGRLTQRLIRDERIAVSVNAGTDGIARGPGLFVLDATPATGVSLATLEARIQEEIARIARDGVEAGELARVKRQARASQVFRRDSMFSLAMEAARLLIVGRTLEDSDNWLAVLNDINSADIQRVAGRYFLPHHLTALEFEPLPLDQAAPRRPAGAGMRH
jgi:zinc protease